MKKNKKDTGKKSTIYGGILTSKNFEEINSYLGNNGHGFAAEKANHLKDIYQGNNAKHVGLDNAKNGADRIVNGQNIQSKYCNSGNRCIRSCFKNGEFRYYNNDGTPMQIEVPSDKYEEAVKAMESRIRRGEVKNVSDPSQAKDIVRKGHYTYEQAKNITKFGNIDSLKFDARNGVIVASAAFSLSAVIAFSVSIWHGEKPKVALQQAALTGLKVGGTTWITSIISSQLCRTSLNSTLKPITDGIVNKIGNKATTNIVNVLRGSGNSIKGAAAASHLSKILRGNIISGAVSTAVLSIGDITNLVQGNISGQQTFKNILITSSSVVGGTAGWLGGVVLGASVGSAVPIIGTIVGGTVGGLLGAFGGSEVISRGTKLGLDQVIEDDIVKLLKIIENIIIKFSKDFLLSKEEIEKIIDSFQSKENISQIMKDMFKNSNREQFAKRQIRPIVESVILKREKVHTPSNADIFEALFDKNIKK
jgi:hypothetical protein